jgi:PIN domain nuclease of toxin-antitoxin system
MLSSRGGIELRLLLDTVTFIWAIESPDRLTPRAATALGTAGNILEMSAVSLSEIAIKASLGKLRISASAVHQALEDLDMHILPYTADHAFLLFDLPLHHRDPFDRQIIAQALAEKIPVVTSDEKFRFYKGLKIIW